MYRFTGNDPGSPDHPNPDYNPRFRTISANFQGWPGLYTVTDTAPTQVATDFQAMYALRGLPWGQHTVTLALDSGKLVLDAVGVVSQPATDPASTTALAAALDQAKKIQRDGDFTDTTWAVLQNASIRAIAVGNGTAGRETESFIRDALREMSQNVPVVMVNESGASVYSASAAAREEFPELDVTVRGAISIARRLQDPLAELVKIDPKSIGVGQYQHDVSQPALKKSLDLVVDSCVNAVGVDVNLASAKLLERVSGLNETLAQNIVAHRDQNGRFASRQDLLKVTRLGPKAFEQCAGFLRVRDGADPLDSSGVHPESYPVVRRILKHLKSEIHAVIGDASALRSLSPEQFADAQFGAPTVTDTGEEPDVVLGIAALSSLLLGGVSPVTLAAAGKLSGHPTALERLHRMAVTPTPPVLSFWF